MLSILLDMMSGEDTMDKLDSEFDHYLVDMKPFVLRLPDKSERQRCALWIKKLCDPLASGSGLMGRKNRNAYARLLLHMLRKGVLEGPFTYKPEAGSLKTLPTYMSVYYDEPLAFRSQALSAAMLPGWVSGELDGDDVWPSTLKDSSLSPQPNCNRRRNLFRHKSPTRPLSSSPVKGTAKEDKRQVASHHLLCSSFKQDERIRRPSSDDSDLEARLNSWNLGIYPKSSLRKRSTLTDEVPVYNPDKESEMRIKVLEAKYQEEKLKLQQRHDADVQKILHRKNGEIEELKNLHRSKMKEAEEAVRALEKKVQSLLRESQVIRQSKDKQIAELKKMLDQSADSLKNELEKKLHTVIAQMEQQKFELQKKHTDNIQELLEDTNQRLAKMEADYGTQARATEQTVRDLEARVKQLSVEVENGNLLRQKVTQEKAELEIHIAGISAELQEANCRNMTLQREKDLQSEEHEDALKKLQAKNDADISHFQKEHALSAAKASEVIEDLEQMVARLKQQLRDSEHQRQKQLRELENKMQHERMDLQHTSDKKVQTLQAELEKERTEARKKSVKLEEALREKEDHICHLRELQRQQVQQAESALESFKKQVELSSEKAYADMKQQMEKVEADLTRSKSLREKQTKEFGHQLEELQQKYEQQIMELKLQHEQERTHLLQQHNTEKDSLVQDHQREIASLEKQARSAMAQHQAQTQEWRKRDGQTISELESQVHSLREELLEAHAPRKQQLSELGLLCEEERQRAAQEQEVALGRVRTEMERVRKDLERTHTAERELAQEKANSRLKQLEKEYTQKLAKSAQTMAELQTTLFSIKDESKQTQLALERQIEEARTHWEEERRQLSRDADRVSKALQERVESLQRQLRTAEKKLMSRELETQEQNQHYTRNERGSPLYRMNSPALPREGKACKAHLLPPHKPAYQSTSLPRSSCTHCMCLRVYSVTYILYVWKERQKKRPTLYFPC
ncbi:centrosomal protein of 112 kDa isoform X4 [Tachysurus fulvidraco]|uniref:centrosomal protein of 112 kDa isoform X4 n=1 Tax=Tachysurus fulvidraco TaxID=1234273 RepID=UPI001FEE5755|nr:centrosomal protein of 112 kDa isoform X4 [Tachysurus fulvidraco]